MSNMKNHLIDVLNKLPQYSAVETGEPCLAYTDVKKILEEEENIKNHEACGLIFTGLDDEGVPQFLGDNEAWKKFDDGSFD